MKKTEDDIKRKIFFMIKRVLQYRSGYHHWQELTAEEQSLAEIVYKIAQS